MLEILSEPTLDLVTTADAKAALGITGTDSDDAVAGLIAQVSAAVQSYLGFQVLVGTYRETFEIRFTDSPGFYLSRYPVRSVASVTVNDVALEVTGYRVDTMTGRVDRLVNGRPCGWGKVQVVVTYDAGHTAAPADVQGAVFSLLRSEWAARSLDPTLKSLSLGSIGLHYFAPDARPGLASVEHLLAPYRTPGVG